jgi:hypothetical protein
MWQLLLVSGDASPMNHAATKAPILADFIEYFSFFIFW